MDVSNEAGWNPLVGFVDDCGRYNLTKIDATRFIAVNDKITEFDTTTNSWSIWNKDIADVVWYQHTNVSYNPATEYMFISLHDRIKIYDIQHNTKVAQYVPEGLLYYARTICADSEFHVICNYRQKKSHLVWDDKSKQLQQIHTFSKYLREFGLIYVDKSKQLLLFGGYDDEYIQGAPEDTIYMFSLKQKIWTKLDAVLPYKMHGFGHIITKDGQYIIIMGGRVRNNSRESDMIYVWNWTTMEMRESKIKSPFKGKCQAVVMENKKENDLLVHGFIRNEICE